jgi:hypothetical protein
MTKDTQYTSEPMNFIQQLVKGNPQLQEKQDKLRKTWWDKDDTEVNQERQLNKNNLPTQGYSYFSYDNSPAN